MEKIVEIGTISSRGQIAIPADIRRQLKLEEGEKILFVSGEDTLIIKKVTAEKTFAELTEPFRKAKKKIREKDVVDVIHRLRKKKRE